MSITAYVGIPGSGKSYEVVSSVIVEHFKRGRRIVTNIEGIDENKLINFCLEDDKNLTFEQLGSLIRVTDEQCQQEDFFPYKGSENTLCRAGDLICLDEIWRIFSTENIHKNHRSFIAEHRHFTDKKTGICCDLVVINQSISGIPRFIKDRVETTYLMSRLLALGMPTRYRVNVYTGAKTTKASLITQYQNKYNPKIFNLYKSFDTKNGKQTQVDDRQNFFKSFTFKLIVFSSIAMFILSYFAFSHFYKSMTKDIKKEEVQQVEVNHVEQIKLDEQKTSTNKKSQEQKFNQLFSRLKEQEALKTTVVPPYSKNWRISGELIKNGQDFVVLVDMRGNLRLEEKRYFKNEGRALEGLINGEYVTYYTGRGDILNENFIFNNK
ncbi:zonular occludens toxin family protein [Pasteurella multocida]|uniref:zonular occludens toxin family protein n=1 Tax=Pasteurella multocida TaxID=747 RepID=UPI002FE2D87D